MRSQRHSSSWLAAACAAGILSAFVATAPASAHVTLEQDTAPADSTYKAVLRVGHGCDGLATTALRVQIPEGIIVAKPMPKPGWEIVLVEGDYERAYDYYGTAITGGVKEIVWRGGSLPDNFYDEFVFRARIAGFAPGATIAFPVVQECGSDAAERWIETPAPGEDPDSYEYPAPLLTVTEPDGH